MDILTVAAGRQQVSSEQLLSVYPPMTVIVSATCALMHVLDDVVDALDGAPLDETVDLLAAEAGVTMTFEVRQLLEVVSAGYHGRRPSQPFLGLRSASHQVAAVEAVAALLCAAVRLVATHRDIPATEIAHHYAEVTERFLLP